MNTFNLRHFLFAGTLAFLLFFVGASAEAASPWAQEPTYWGKTKGKLAFGLKNSLLGWVGPWAEARQKGYRTEWEGFSAGIGKGVLYMAGGVLQVATFFIPVDFPDIGGGLPIPDPKWHPVMYCKKGQVCAPAKTPAEKKS
ncbi:MAG TPA: hypothetical protein PLL75_05865 [Candidatus Omnitrophota bacterium]|nr:hypothetical protein [Candidatus Omnitrophota bacterium]HPS37234.1 hypothetical protein [Candidatus Omnitrophota bacterium]